MVNHQIDKYSWSFVYIGGGDLETQKAQGAALGIRSNNIHNYSTNSGGTKAVYGSVGSAFSRRRGAVAVVLCLLWIVVFGFLLWYVSDIVLVASYDLTPQQSGVCLNRNL